MFDKMLRADSVLCDQKYSIAEIFAGQKFCQAQGSFVLQKYSVE